MVNVFTEAPLSYAQSSGTRCIYLKYPVFNMYFCQYTVTRLLSTVLLLIVYVHNDMFVQIVTLMFFFFFFLITLQRYDGNDCSHGPRSE